MDADFYQYWEENKHREEFAYRFSKKLAPEYETNQKNFIHYTNDAVNRFMAEERGKVLFRAGLSRINGRKLKKIKLDVHLIETLSISASQRSCELNEIQIDGRLFWRLFFEYHKKRGVNLSPADISWTDKPAPAPAEEKPERRKEDATAKRPDRAPEYFRKHEKPPEKNFIPEPDVMVWFSVRSNPEFSPNYEMLREVPGPTNLYKRLRNAKYFIDMGYTTEDAASASLVSMDEMERFIEIYEGRKVLLRGQRWPKR